MLFRQLGIGNQKTKNGTVINEVNVMIFLVLNAEWVFISSYLIFFFYLIVLFLFSFEALVRMRGKSDINSEIESRYTGSRKPCFYLLMFFSMRWYRFFLDLSWRALSLIHIGDRSQQYHRNITTCYYSNSVVSHRTVCNNRCHVHGHKRKPWRSSHPRGF